MDEGYVVEKAIPIPENKHSLDPIRNMEVGESVMFPREKRNTIQSYVSRYGSESGKTFTVRIVDDINCRAWRTK